MSDLELNELINRIKLRRQELDMSYQDLSDLTGISKSTLQRYETGFIKKVPITQIEIIAKALRIDPAYLMGWNNTSPAPRLPYPQLTPAKYKKFKVLGNIACGKPIEAVTEHGEYIETEFNIHADYVLLCQGDSMINARIFNGDYVFIKEQPEVENGEIAAVWMDGEVTLKRFYRHDDYIELRAENPTYKPIIIHETDFDSVHVIGKAVACQFIVKE